ncbi:MAG: hypothetical protein JOZ74_04525 [Bradyrhizobium sp.]|nr:hypothetical protein [Bradyrhizobium sp.]
MMRFRGWAITAGLVLAAAAADAQTPAPTEGGRSFYHAVSDVDGPYAAMPPAPPPAPPPVYGYGGYGPPLMPPQEVYAVLRDNGFSPLGVPRQRGLIYFIAVVDRAGNDGRLVIDARDGRILRFVPSYGYGSYLGPFGPERLPGYGPISGVPRPPALVPHVASRTVPLPLPKPAVAGNPPSTPPHQSAAIQPNPTTATTPPPAKADTPPTAQASVAPPASTSTVGEAKPVPVIRPTQQMPPAQGLE